MVPLCILQLHKAFRKQELVPKQFAVKLCYKADFNFFNFNSKSGNKKDPKIYVEQGMRIQFPTTFP